MNSDPVARWEEILRSRYWDELLALAGSDKSSLYVKFSDLERCDPEFARELLERPEKMLGTARAALLQIDLPKDAHLDRVQVRITELPGHFRIGQLNSAHIDRLIAIEGRVVKADKARSRRVSSAVFLCLRCGNVFLQDLSGRSSTVAGMLPLRRSDCKNPWRISKKECRLVSWMLSWKTTWWEEPFLVTEL